MTLKGVDAWLSRLNASELPVLGGVINDLSKLTDSDQTHVNQLSELILKDSNLTSQLLRVANSIHYNPGGTRINTVTRAIVQVGFEGVKNICISLMLVDQLLSDHPRERLLHVMSLAFHAALQAKCIAPADNSEHSEQVFIAALLLHVGEMAIWSKGESQADELDQQMLLGVSEHDACEQVLGTQFRTLTRALVQSWHLSPILDASFRSGAKDPLSRAVQLGDALSRASEFGWDSKTAKTTLEEVAKFRRISVDQAREDAIRTAELAGEVISLFGVAATHTLSETGHAQHGIVVGVPDNKQQMTMLKKLSAAVRQGQDFSGIFQLVVQGLYLGVAFARVAIVLRLQDQLVAKFCAGRLEKVWRKQFLLNARDVHFFSEALNYTGVQLFDEPRLLKCGHLYTEPVAKLIGQVPCLVAPVVMNNRTGGVFYADNDGEAITAEQQESFELFVHQAQILLQSASLQIRPRK